MSLYMGVIADDFSGASDAASFFANNKIRTILSNGVPDKEDKILNDIISKGAVLVIALKIRSVDKETALIKVEEAYKYLENKDAQQYFYKYCSTFDSTPEGNIGPIVDFLLEKTNQDFTILEPALPINGRIIKDGILYVNGIKLGESHMKDHPLNPMWDSKISELMNPQGKYETIDISISDMKKWNEYHNTLQASHSESKFYLVPDYYETGHDDLIISTFGNLKFLSGGSGLNNSISKKIMNENEIDEYNFDIKNNGKTIFIVGSCSEMTLNQIKNYKGLKFKIDIDRLVTDFTQYVKNLNKHISESDSIMFYSSDSSKKIKDLQDRYGQKDITNRLELLYELLTREAMNLKYRNFIIAGGETSGVATKTLGIGKYLIGNSVSPGVPILMPVENPNIRLILKSGNFGDKNFFNIAKEMIVG